MKLNKRKALMKTSAVLSVTGFSAVFISSCSVLTYDSSVQLIVSDQSSQLADQSFSESTYDGIKEFMKDAIGANLPDAKYVRENSGLWKRPGEDDDSRRTAYKYAVTNGAKLIVASGYNQQTALQQVTSNDEKYAKWKDFFKDTGFVFVDGSMEAKSPTNYNSDPNNVASVSFRADDGSFLAGISTAVFLNYNIDKFKTGPSGSGLGVSSFIGLPLASTLSYMNGFRLGIHYWNTVLQPLIKTVDDTTPTEKIKWINPDDPNNSNTSSWDISSFTSGSFSTTEQKATTLSTNMRKAGANAIFPIAGPQTSLVVSEIASDKASNSLSRTITIGVDVAQENTDSLKTKLEWLGSNDTVGNNQILQFSSVKNLSHATSSILMSIINGQNNKESNGWSADQNKVNSSSENKSSDTWYGLGWNNVGTLNNGSVGVSDAGLKYLIDPYFWVNNVTSKTDATSNTSLETWTNTSLTFNSVKLKDLVDDTTGKYHATQLVASDPVISKYANLLSGTVKTPTSVKSASSSLADSETNSNGSIQLGETGNSNKTTRGLNGPTGNGDWTIKNDTNGSNSTLSVSLSSLLPAINGSSASYPVASNTAQYIATKPTEINLTKSDMYYRKN